ncbi:hypothetical protein OSTOST_16646, partial [Ostertagia ostertagi]
MVYAMHFVQGLEIGIRYGAGTVEPGPPVCPSGPTIPAYKECPLFGKSKNSYYPLTSLMWSPSSPGSPRGPGGPGCCFPNGSEARLKIERKRTGFPDKPMSPGEPGAPFRP